MKESTLTILLQSRFMKDGGPILWNAIAICEMFKTSLLTDGKSQNERIFWRIFQGHALFAAGIFGEEHILIAEIEESEKLDASETYPRVIRSPTCVKFHVRTKIEKCSQVSAFSVHPLLICRDSHSDQKKHVVVCILLHYDNFAHEFVPMVRSRQSSSLNSL